MATKGRKKTRPENGHMFLLAVPRETWDRFKINVSKNDTFNEVIVGLIEDYCNICESVDQAISEAKTILGDKVHT